MLANLFPALRDLRTPLASGYILLAAIYVAMFEKLKRLADQDILIKDIVGVSKYVGSGATLACVTFLAFLLGSMWSDSIPAALRWLTWLALTKPREYFLMRSIRRHLLFDKVAAAIAELPTRNESLFFGRRYREQLRQLVCNLVRREVRDNADYSREFFARLYEREMPNNDSIVYDSVIERVVDVRRHIDEIVADAKNIPARLLGKESDTWNSWDRLRAEAEFRAGVATSLIPFSIVLAWNSSNWYLLIILAAVHLWILGERKGAEALGNLYESLVAERVTLSSVDNVKNFQHVTWLRADTTNVPPESRENLRISAMVREREEAERARQDALKLAESRQAKGSAISENGQEPESKIDGST